MISSLLDRNRVLIYLFLVLIINTGGFISALPNDIFRVVDVFDVIKNKSGDINTVISNNGIVAYDLYNLNDGLSIDSINYFRSIGFGIACKKGDTKYFSLSYNPDNKVGEFVPGRMEDGKDLDSNKKDLYQVLSSRLYDMDNGEVLFGGDEPIWSLWQIDDEDRHRYIYEIEAENRSLDNYESPYFYGDEHIFTTFKDSDLLYNNNPIGVQIEGNIHFFESDELKNSFILSYKVINMSKEMLKGASFNFYFDPEITKISQKFNSIRNEKVFVGINDADEKFYYIVNQNDSLNEKEGGEGLEFSRVIGIKSLDETEYNLIQLDNSEDYGDDEKFYDYLQSTKNDKFIEYSDLNFFLKSEQFELEVGESKIFSIAVSMTEEKDSNVKSFVARDLKLLKENYYGFRKSIISKRLNESKNIKIIDRVIYINKGIDRDYKIINLLGEEIESGKTGRNGDINIKELHGGLYILILRNQNNVEFHKFLIK